MAPDGSAQAFTSRISAMGDILWLDDARTRDTARVGAKAANLAAYFGSHNVPPGFVLPALPAAWTELPPMLVTQIAMAYEALAERCGMQEPCVAVRSSALDEDGPGSSFAGQHDTYLNIRGRDAVVDAVLRCVRSATSAEALSYRKEHSLQSDDVKIAVLVQQLVPSDVSAVVFSCNPVTGAHDEVMITSNWGLGESIVGGMVNPDTFVVAKDGCEILDRMISCKTHMTVRHASGTHEVEVAEERRESPSLTDAQIVAIAQLALSLEQATGHPVDVECAIASGSLYLLQCRPVTSL